MKHSFLDKLGYTANNGLVHNVGEARNNVERLYIDGVQRSLVVPASAVFFRRFYGSDEEEAPVVSIPAVCIFNRGDAFFNSEDHKVLHAELWSAGKTEVYIILGETQIDIINARKPAKQQGKDVSLYHTDLRLVSAAVKAFEDTRFSAHLFSNGTFWEQPELQSKIDGNSTPYDFLLTYLMEARKSLLGDKRIELGVPTIDRLLITAILIKFLEEIKDDDGKHTLKEVYKKHGLTEETFEEGLRMGKCQGILSDLAAEFNGKVFDTFSSDEKEAISKANLTPLADFLSADIDLNTSQGFLWKQYSFAHLPAEVISAIYENFIQAEADRNAEIRKDVVYTPLHLVNLMIDEAMPLEKPELFEHQIFRILDPACGSGVFLVAAYKRLLQWWAINEWRRTDKVVYPNKETAKQILEDNIFGVDIEKVAALVSIFGLTTAFLDKLTPKEIWDNLKFKDLSQHNIQGLNFADWAIQAKEKGERFELVIGNPPFNDSPNGTITNENLKHLVGKSVPGNKLALKFLELALRFGEKVCMIIPSNVFLYNKSEPSSAYRKGVFTDCTVEKIYDFTHLRRDLFHNTADVPVMALIVQNTPSKGETIEHIVVKRQILGDKKLHFEIDYYDKHPVRLDWAIDEQKQFVWKTNLLGGGRLFHLVYRLSLLETFGSFIEKMKNENSEWAYSVGYKVEGAKKKKDVDYIHNKPSIITKSFDDSEDFRTFIEGNNDFAEPRNQKIYEPPHLIFKTNLGRYNVPVHYSEEYLCFKDKLVGLHSPEECKQILYDIYRKFKKPAFAKFMRFWIYSSSSETIINLETACKKEDIDSMPFPADEEYTSFYKHEEVIQNDVLSYLIHLGKAITKGNAGKILHDPITESELKSFGQIFCEVLNDIYQEDGNSWQMGKVVETPTLIAYQLGFGKDGGLPYDYSRSAESSLYALIDNPKSNTGVRFKRIIRRYQHVDGYDCVYLIKPKARRYWLQSIALRDADDTFIDLKKAGY